MVSGGRRHLCVCKRRSSSLCLFSSTLVFFTSRFRLNHCVGGRNYVAFLMCVVSAVVAALVMLTAVITELVLYYMKSDWLIIWPTASTATASNNNNSNNSEDFYPIQNDTIPSAIFNQTFNGNDTFIGAEDVANATESALEAAVAAAGVVGGISLHDTIFLAFISVLGILAAITVGLLLHLCFFHVYISFLGLTTYEYIRNQRQNAAQPSNEASANTSKTNSHLKMPDATLNALKKSSSSASTQLYFCSTIDPKNLIETLDANVKYRPKSLHCCDTSMQYQKTSHKAFYVCSMLHERTTSPLQQSSRTFHCCSEYKQVIDLPSSRQSTTNGAANVISSLSTNDDLTPSIVQFTEQCTFCSFKLKPTAVSPPIVHEPQQTNGHRHQESIQMRNNERFYDAKTLSKHHRWKRKWNCCSNVPDSPDVPPGGDVIRTISSSIASEQNEPHTNNNRQHRHHHHHHHHHQDSSHQNGAKAVNHSSVAKQSNQALKNAGVRPSLATNLKNTNRPRSTRPMARFRHILRMFGRKRQSPSHENASPGNVCRRDALPSHKVNVKANQVRPLSMSEEQVQQQNASHTILSASMIGSVGHDHDSDDNEIAYNNIQVPALPPPTRHKICSPSELEDLTKSLNFVQQPPSTVHQQSSTATSSKQHRFAGNSSGSRRRRKNLLRTRSPTLSPIHESGYSNPTSPPSTPRSTNSLSAHHTTSSSA